MRRHGQKKNSDKEKCAFNKKQTTRCRTKTVQCDISMEQVQGCSLHNINGKFITGRNEVLAKVIFSQASVILFTGGVWSRGVSNFSGGLQIFGVVSKFSEGLQIFGGSPNFWGVSKFLGVSNFSGGWSPNFQGVSKFSGGLQFLGGLHIFEGVVSNFQGVSKFSGGFSTGIRSTFGWYASYWNAFLLFHKYGYQSISPELNGKVFVEYKSEIPQDLQCTREMHL